MNIAIIGPTLMQASQDLENAPVEIQTAAVIILLATISVLVFGLFTLPKN